MMSLYKVEHFLLSVGQGGVHGTVFIEHCSSNSGCQSRTRGAVGQVARFWGDDLPTSPKLRRGQPGRPRVCPKTP